MPRSSPGGADPRALALFLPWMANSRGWGLLSCQIPLGGSKKEGNAPSSVNAATLFIVHVHKTSRRDYISLWF